MEASPLLEVLLTYTDMVVEQGAAAAAAAAPGTYTNPHLPRSIGLATISGGGGASEVQMFCCKCRQHAHRQTCVRPVVSKLTGVN
jgi:hypothetical protein